MFLHHAYKGKQLLWLPVCFPWQNSFLKLGAAIEGQKWKWVHSFESIFIHYNQLYTGGLFHFYMLGESICNFRGVRFFYYILYFWWKILFANSVQCRLWSDTTLCGHFIWGSALPHYVAFGFGVCTVCLWPIHRFPGKNGLNFKFCLFYRVRPWQL